MLNRILYWFITLPMLAKSGCFGVVGVVFVCSCLMLATIPGANARIAQQATQTAVSGQVQATEAGVARAATSAAQSTALVQAHTDATATRFAQATALVQAHMDATATNNAAAGAATEAANSGVTATAQAAHQATEDANAAAAIEQANCCCNRNRCGTTNSDTDP